MTGTPAADEQSRSLRVAVIVTDPRRGVSASTTDALIAEGVRRRHRVCIAYPGDLHQAGRDLVLAGLQAAGGSRSRPSLASTERQSRVCDFDCVLLRVQPPVDLQYVSMCQMLSAYEDRVLFVNRPSSLLLYAEKLFLTQWPTLSPDGLVSSSLVELAAFRERCGDVVLKPLYDYQSRAVHLCRRHDPNFNVICDDLLRLYDAPIVAQRFIPEVEQDGDRRILAVDGTPVAALRRIPQRGGFRASLHAGASYESSDLTSRDHEIFQEIGGPLRDRGFLFVGLDVISGYATEIALASPTGLKQIADRTGIDLSAAVWDAIERRVGTAEGLRR